MIFAHILSLSFYAGKDFHASFNGSQLSPTIFLSSVRRIGKYTLFSRILRLIKTRTVVGLKAINERKELLLFRHFRNSNLKIYDNATEG
jgi:hypothetical protein